MHALDVPRRKPWLVGSASRPETVYWSAERSAEKHDRAYDKGAEQGNVGPGVMIRLEARVRVRADARTAAEWWSPERVQERFLARFGAMGKSAEGLHVGSERYLREQLRDFAAGGRITSRMAAVLMGHIAGESVGLPQPNRTRRYHRAELRRLGLALALDGVDDDAPPLDLGAVLDDVLTSPHWHD
jgi:hypothetical protein